MSGASNAFARVTREHRLISLSLPPCANYLYLWLLAAAPAGKQAEIYLEDFQSENQNRFGGRGYTLTWIKKALKLLVEQELVDVIYKFNSKVFKLVTWHPDRHSAADLKKTPQTSKKTSQSYDKSSQSQPSNMDSAVTSYREIKETTEKTTHHPVETNKQEKVIDSANQVMVEASKPEPKISVEVHQVLEAAGFKPNTTLKTTIAQAEAQNPRIVSDAIEAVKQYQINLQRQQQPLRREPEAMLVKAIQEQWKPNLGSERSGTSVMPPEFDKWFGLAKSAGLVRASSAQADVTHHEPGVLCVLSSQGWQPFTEMLRCFPLKEVQELADRRHHSVMK